MIIRWLKYFLLAISTLWGGLVFTVAFMLSFPFFLLIIPFPRLHRLAYLGNIIMGIVSFPLWFIYLKNEFHGFKDPGSPVIFCANHFSYLDIPVTHIAPKPFVFLGKKSFSKIPLFGYMFKKLHITVDRGNKRAAYQTYLRANKKLQEGLSLMIFPEGGIRTMEGHQMAKFKDGAFRMAIERQLPIVPTAIIGANKLQGSVPFTYLRPGKCTVIYHALIPTVGMTVEDVPALKEQVYSRIQTTLNENY